MLIFLALLQSYWNKQIGQMAQNLIPSGFELDNLGAKLVGFQRRSRLLLKIAHFSSTELRLRRRDFSTTIHCVKPQRGNDKITTAK